MDQLKKLVVISGVFVLLSCGGERQALEVSENTPVAEIFAAAKKEVARGRGTAAGDYYLEVERIYPYTPEAERALILAAQAYHDDKALTESRVAAERYLQFFPGSKDAALAQYLVALSYYDAIVDITRDQERTFNALKALQIVMDDYPGSQYAKLSAPKFEIALSQLAGKEMEIGRYYLSKRDFVAAIARFKAVITEYPENKHKSEAYHRMIEAYLSLGLRDEASRVYAEFGKYSTKSSWYQQSTSLLKTGRQSQAGGNVLRQIILGSWQ